MNKARVKDVKNVLDSQLNQMKHINNNSIAAIESLDAEEHTEIEEGEDNSEEAQTFLTVERVSAIIENAMMKQRIDMNKYCFTDE